MSNSIDDPCRRLRSRDARKLHDLYRLLAGIIIVYIDTRKAITVSSIIIAAKCLKNVEMFK